MSASIGLPRGTITIAIGLLISGISAYAFFAIGERALGEAAFAPVQALWFATFALSPGVFVPLEQEVSRSIASRLALGDGPRPVAVQITKLGLGLAAISTLIIFAAAPWITENYFEGNGWFTVALAIAFLSYALVHLARGVASGLGQFGLYSAIMAGDGIVRVTGAGVLLVLGTSGAVPFGLAIALAPAIAVGAALTARPLHLEPGSPSSWSEVTPNLGWLLIGSLATAILVNAGPITVNLLRSDDEAELASRFGFGVLLARIPLFLFLAVQAALLPRLSRLAATGNFEAFRSGFRRLVVLVAAVGIVGTAAAWVIGPRLAEALYGTTLTSRTMTALVAGTALYMLALTFAQAVLALDGHVTVAVGWVIGLVVFVVAVAVIDTSLFRRVEIALILSAAASAAVFAVDGRRRRQRAERLAGSAPLSQEIG